MPAFVAEYACAGFRYGSPHVGNRTVKQLAGARATEANRTVPSILSVVIWMTMLSLRNALLAAKWGVIWGVGLFR